MLRGLRMGPINISWYTVNYPTMEEVEKADKLQLGIWWRFLPSPGTSGLNLPMSEFKKVMVKEADIQKRIMERFNEKGGWTTRISKAVGWDPR